MEYATTLSDSILKALGRIMEYVPVLGLAFIVFVLALIVSPIAGGLVHRFLRFLKVDSLAERIGVSQALSEIGFDFSFAKVIGEIVKFIVFIIFLNIVVEIMGLTQITELVDDLIRYIPQVIIAVVLFGAGITFGDLFKKTTMKMSGATSMSDRDGALLGTIGKFAILTFAGMAALVQLGIAQTLVQILFTGIVAGSALAVGLGSKKRVEEFWDDLSRKKD